MRGRATIRAEGADGRDRTGRAWAHLIFEDRSSDCAFVERVWRSHSDRAGDFLSVAANHFEMVVTRVRGRTLLTLRGPETKATIADCPADGDWLGIRFTLGTFMPRLPPGNLRDRRDVTLPGATSRAFWLNGSACEYPTFENAEEFVARLARQGIIARDASVEAALGRHSGGLSQRSTQRHFLRATGLTQGTVRQIERARYATNLLRGGVTVLDAVYESGYFDQPHLARSLKCLVGQTPMEIMRGGQQLSFLYKTTRLTQLYDAREGGLHDRITTDCGVRGQSGRRSR